MLLYSEPGMSILEDSLSQLVNPELHDAVQRGSICCAVEWNSWFGRSEHSWPDEAGNYLFLRAMCWPHSIEHSFASPACSPSVSTRQIARFSVT